MGNISLLSPEEARLLLNRYALRQQPLVQSMIRFDLRAAAKPEDTRPWQPYQEVARLILQEMFEHGTWPQWMYVTFDTNGILLTVYGSEHTPFDSAPLVENVAEAIDAGVAELLTPVVPFSLG